MWLRWRSKSSSSAGYWLWEHFPGPLRSWEPGKTEGLDLILRKETRSNVEAFLESKSEENSWSEHHRGIEWKLFDDGYCPTWVVDQQLAELEKNMIAAQASYTRQLSALSIEKVRARGCPQCEGATPWEITTKISGNYRPCPYCGLRVLDETMPFWIIPGDLPGSGPEEVAAYELLHSLVTAPRSTKGKIVGLIKHNESRAMQILVDRGLAGQSCGPEGQATHVHARGKLEWEKHQNRNRPKLKPKAKRKTVNGRKRS